MFCLGTQLWDEADYVQVANSVSVADEFAELLSEEGSKQGCPLGGLLFVLSVAAIAEDVVSRYPSVTILGLTPGIRPYARCHAIVHGVSELRRRVRYSLFMLRVPT